MKQVFKPMAYILALKHQDMQAAAKAADKLQKWLKGASDNEDDEKDAEEGDDLEIIFEETLYKERAFASHANAPAMRRAADYSDQWFVARAVSYTHLTLPTIYSV